MKQNIVFGCYICKKGVSVKELMLDEEGYVISSNSHHLTDNDNHFICKECFDKIQKYFDIELKID